MISASVLNRKIIIERSTIAKDVVGTPVETYVKFKEKWANVYISGGSTNFESMGALANTAIDFTIRYDNDIDYSCRIKYDGQYYKILHIEQIGRKEGLKIRTIVWED